MPKPKTKIILSASRDIPFNQLVLSQANVRRIKAGISIEELAEDIARRTLLQSLTVRPVLDEAGAETGLFEIPAGGRRYRALELLIRQKRLPRTAPIPCIVRTGGMAEEDSLAENVQRAPLHPLDQFRAFQTLREKGQSEEEIAAAFFVSPQIVKQRLRLATVSPKLLEAYAEDGMTLDMLMAFTVSSDHERQEQVWQALERSQTREPYQIRRMLTAGAVRVSDKRARFIGLEAYMAGGGTIARDLFQPDDGGWLQEPALLERLVAEKLERDAEKVRAEGWKWVEIAPDFPYGHTYGLRRLAGEEAPMSEADSAVYEGLRAEQARLEEDYAQAVELPEKVDRRLAEIETALEAMEDHPVIYNPADQAIAGAFVSIDGVGGLRIERGYVRPEDEPPVASAEDENTDAASAGSAPASATDYGQGGPADPAARSEEEDDGIRPLPDRLMAELTAHRTLALRDALASDPQTAFLAVLHGLCLKLFYRYGLHSCLEIEAKSALFGAQGPGLADSPSAKAVDGRHEAWLAQLPKDSDDLWGALIGFDTDRREGLFAHCAALTLNAVRDSYNPRIKAIAHADRLADILQLDMAAAGWRPTAETYLARVTKGRILEAVREAKGEAAAERISGLNKPEMIDAAEALLAGSGWLPEPLRTPEPVVPADPETDREAAEGSGPADAEGLENPDPEPQPGVACGVAAE